MFADLRDFENDTVLETDLCIIGAGPAGISIALEFANTSTQVLLLESGGIELEPDTQDLYLGENIGLPYYDLAVARLRVFGGSSNHWNNWCGELSELDFLPRAWVPHSGWPITAADLAPYYRRARPLCSIDQARPDAAIWSGIGAQPLPLDPAFLEYRFFEYAPRTRFGKVYGGQLQAAPNLCVLFHANVTNIQSDPQARQVECLDLRTLGGRRATVRARNYVLACGGIENARLLLASNTVEPNGLGNRHDLVGRFFQEHPHYRLGTVLSGDPYAVIDRFAQNWAGEYRRYGYAPGLTLSGAMQGRTEVLNCAAVLSYDEADSALTPVRRMGKALRRGHLPDLSAEDLWEIARNLDLVGYGLYRRTLLGRPALPRIGDLKHIGFLAHNEQAPNPESRILLTNKRDALGMPQVALDWRLTALDRHSMVHQAKAIGAELSRVGAGLFQVEPWLREEGDLVPDEIYGAFHHMGTTRMAADEKQGVVDANAKVHNLANLYIAGSSVFPTGGSVNPTLTIVALALRLADHLRSSAAA